jgi:hypothetical protein
LGAQSRRSRALLVVLGCFGLLVAAGLTALARLAPLGPPLVEISLLSGEATEVPDEALEVLVRFPYTERTRPETLRVTLNGADVTESFSIAENGAIGEVVMLVDGANVLRAAVFGQAWWGKTQLIEFSSERHFRVRRPVDRFWG